jgi:hypothetical protein
MSVRENPVANRICDMKDKGRAYQKHLDALASAKTTIDTSSPELSRRARAKGALPSRQQPRRIQGRNKPPKQDNDSDSDYDHLPKETIEKVKIGFTEKPVIEVQEVSQEPRDSKIPIRRRGSPQNQAETVDPEDPPLFPTQETSFKRSVRLVDEFMEVDEREDEALPPRPKTAPRTPRSSRLGNSGGFDDLPNEDVPALGEDPPADEGRRRPANRAPETFDEFPQFEFPDG